NTPENIAFDKAGNFYIAETNGNRIRTLSSSGVIRTFAGTGISGYSGDGGKASSARLWFPFGVTADSGGNVFIADSGNNVIRKVNTAGIITTFAKDPSFLLLAGLATDSTGNVYAADFGACVVWHITPAGAISIFAGLLNSCGFNADGISATAAKLNTPYGVAVASNGNVYIGDASNNRVRKVAGGIISTFAAPEAAVFPGTVVPPRPSCACRRV
ncbi:MAG: hypothetical protein DMG75_12175, partial [Acidobacteria bacterium]